MNKKSNIKVVEPVGTYKGTISSFEGYKAMQKGREYILFLFKDPQNDRYGIVAINQGKHSTDGTVEIYSEGKEEPEYKRIEKFTKAINEKYSKPSLNDSPNVTGNVYSTQNPKGTNNVTGNVYK
ncbi:hypothetical protein LJK87_15990 [Paenibacillus sp. P25]|nr:hypothetical protein LJK87_15990 [Paenibacillus sp. P25]